MKNRIIPWVLILFGTTAHSVFPAEWYDMIRPGITHAEVLKLAGTPSLPNGETETYARPMGKIQCTYEGDILQSAIYFAPSDGTVSRTLYITEGETKDRDLALRRAYLKAGSFAVLPTFQGRKIYTNKYSGPCYEVDGGFIVVEPIIRLLGGVGFFSNKAAEVRWLKPDGSENVLYRALDHWQELKPTGLLASEAKRRTAELKAAGQRVYTMKIDTILGKSDSEMGSGVNYQLFYLEDGLAMVTSDFREKRIKSVFIMRPGSTDLTFDEWLGGAPAKAKL